MRGSSIPSDQGSSFPCASQRPTKCPRDVKILCRLIAAHERNPRPRSVVKCFIDGETNDFNVLLNVNVGQNIKCLVYEKSNSDKAMNSPSLPERHRSTNEQQERQQSVLFMNNRRCASASRASFHDTRFSEIIFAFNWFSPSGIWDYMSLGMRLLSSANSGIETNYHLCGKLSMQHANEFFHHPDIRSLLQELKLGYIDTEGNNVSRGNIHPTFIHAVKITVTGFSMGGATAHAFSVLLKEENKMPQKVRCVGFGCSRPGNARLREWIQRNLTTDSMNIVLACEETAATDHDREEHTDKSTEEFFVRKSIDMSESSSGCFTGKQARRVCFFCNDDPDVPVATVPKSPYQVFRRPHVVEGFDIHPNCYVVVKSSGGYLSLMTEQERERLKRLELKENVETWPLSVMLNMATRLSPFKPEVARGLDQLHSILKYYEALCGVD